MDKNKYSSYECEAGDVGNNRRAFLKSALMVGMAGAAAAVGTAGWLGLREEATPATVALPKGSPAELIPAPTIAPTTAESVEQLTPAGEGSAHVQAMLAQRDAELKALRGELAGYKSQVASLETEMGSTESRLGVLGGLLALYEQLHALELDELAAEGLREMGEALEGAFTRLPPVERGLEVVEEAVSGLEGSLPTMQAGLGWLLEGVDQLANGLQEIEDALGETVEPLQPLASKLGAFFSKLLGWVPFGMGRRVERGLNAIGLVLTHIPELVRESGHRIVEPLQALYGEGKEGVRIRTRVIDPIREQGMLPAGELTAEVRGMGEKVRDKVALPLAGRLDARRPLREQITRYKQQYGL